MNKVLITGGSGFIGTNMVEYYTNRGDVVCNVDIVSPLDKSQKKHWIKADINSESDLIQIFKKFNPSYVIHLAASTGLGLDDISQFKTNIDGVRSLINSCNSISSVKKVIFTSSLLVAERTYVPNNDIDFKPDSVYGESKVIGENIVRDCNLKSSWAIVRPTAVWGPWFRSSYTTFFQLIDKGIFINPGRKKLEKPATFVGNTVFMIDKILKSYETHGEVYYLADYPEYSIQEWGNSIATEFGTRLPITLPKLLIVIFAKIGDLLIHTRVHSNPPISTFRLKNMFSSARYNIKRTSSIVGDLPYDLDSGVGITVKWMKNNLNK